jgi:hypothetical protein
MKENDRETHMATLQPNELWHSHLIQLGPQKHLREFETQQMMKNDVKGLRPGRPKRSTSQSWINLLRVEKAHSIMVPGTTNYANNIESRSWLNELLMTLQNVNQNVTHTHTAIRVENSASPPGCDQ